LRNQYPLGTATNVFAIGKILLNLMTLSKVETVQPSSFTLPNNGRIEIPSTVRDRYSRELVNLIQQCIEPVPSHRITVDALLENITNMVEKHPADYDSVPMKLDKLPDGAAVWTKKDEYLLFAK